MVPIHPEKIEGNWLFGVALDLHTTSSRPAGPNEAGHMQFDTVRPPIAELLYKLKYGGDRGAAAGIIAAAAGWLGPHRGKIDILIPVPASTHRAVQPVLILANGIGAATGLPVVNCITMTRSATPLKTVNDPAQRQKLLAGLYSVDAGLTAGKNILLFDDLFRSGATLNAITDVLIKHGKVASVRVLTITRTRSKQ
jgi:predicted amidophosphoribosyltransferase